MIFDIQGEEDKNETDLGSNINKSESSSFMGIRGAESSLLLSAKNARYTSLNVSDIK